MKKHRNEKKLFFGLKTKRAFSNDIVVKEVSLNVAMKDLLRRLKGREEEEI